MAEETNKEPVKITREEADQLNDFAQGLNDPITHIVDYGDLSPVQAQQSPKPGKAK